MPSPKNLAIIAAAGSRKTELIIEAAIATPDKRVLITTYTNENQRQIKERTQNKCGGTVPEHITIMGWFTFLVNECARPYQNSVTGLVGYMGSLDFVGSRYQGTPKKSIKYFFDSHGDIYRNGVSDFACEANAKSKGKVIKRLEGMFDHIFIDEVQDLVGYDLDLLDLLFKSSIGVTVVGDPRQHTLATNTGPRNKKYKKEGILDWFKERTAICALELRTESFRCNQLICDFADELFPTMAPTTSKNNTVTGHDGIFVITRKEVAAYVAQHNPTIIRENKRTNTEGLSGINIGVSKGSTYDRILIFPASTALKYVNDRDLVAFKGRERLYVAVTRARFSATFVQ